MFSYWIGWVNPVDVSNTREITLLYAEAVFIFGDALITSYKTPISRSSLWKMELEREKGKSWAGMSVSRSISGVSMKLVMMMTMWSRMFSVVLLAKAVAAVVILRALL